MKHTVEVDRRALSNKVLMVLALQLSSLVPLPDYPVVLPIKNGPKTALQVREESEGGFIRYQTESYYHAVVSTIHAKIMQVVDDELTWHEGLQRVSQWLADG